MSVDQEQPVSLERLEHLLTETHELAKQNHKILRRMERNALLGFLARVVLWLLVLGVPLFFFGPYLKPLFSLVSQSTTATSTPKTVFGLPSAQELQAIVRSYKSQ